MQLSPRSTGLFRVIVTCSGLADPWRSSKYDDVMNHTMRLQLSRLNQEAWGYRFGLQIANESDVSLFVPTPRITDLRFTTIEMTHERDWYMDMAVSGEAAGIAFSGGN